MTYNSNQEVSLNSEYLNLLAFQQGGDGSGVMSTVLMFGLIILIFYFFILRPQQKRSKERQKLLESLKKGDKVVTLGGIHGTIMGMDDKTILIQVTDAVKLKFEKSAVTSITGG